MYFLPHRLKSLPAVTALLQIFISTQSAAASVVCSKTAICPEGEFCNFDGGNSGSCEFCVNNVEECDKIGLPKNGTLSCAQSCISKTCSISEDCEGDSFCNDGFCESCPRHIHECFNMSLSEISLDTCASSCALQCESLSNVTVNDVPYESNGFIGSPPLMAEGILVDCDFGQDGGCEDSKSEHADNDYICLIRRGGIELFYGEKVKNCEKNGGVGAIIYDNTIKSDPLGGTLSVSTNIPSVGITMNDGEYLLSEEIGSYTNILVEDLGENCRTECSVFYPCQEDNQFCNFDYGDHGFCQVCPSENEMSCFFWGLPQEGVQDCGSVCGENLVFSDCKFCPNDIDAISFGNIGEDGKCEFCPENDMKYPERHMEMYGEDITCWLVDEFFTNYEIDANDPNCKLAQMNSYICGCSGPGYAGAGSKSKQALLVWLPRIMAILSFMGSSYIVYDIAKDQSKRKLIRNQLMLVLSIFDAIGSIAYALTSIPVPKSDYIYGSKGNDATCKAQGFFIQIGTVAAYLNVSIALYYLLRIKFEWHDEKFERLRIWLFICPIVIGLSFAFAGIPFYDNMILWCNNSAKWWPDIFMIVAIILATIFMGAMTWHVYGVDKSAGRYQSQSTRGLVSSKVISQSILYLMSFYMTWPPYLALQYMWASGKAYTAYGFVLYAGTAVPLQGVWNFFSYIPKHSQGTIINRIRAYLSNTNTVANSTT